MSRLLACLVLVAGCQIEVDYTGTRFSCAQSQACPGDLVCVDQLCVAPGSTPDGGGDDGQLTLTVTGTIAGTVVDAPILVSLDPSRFDYGLAAADGSDVRFVDSAGAPLAHEIESWNPGGTSILWVKLPALETGAELTMLYGDGTTATEQPAEVWSEYEIVHHLSGADDSRGGLTATARDGAAFGPGRLAGGVVLDGVDDYFEVGQNLSLLRAASGVTSSGWVNRAAADSGSYFEVSINGGGGSRMFTFISAAGEIQFGVRTLDDPASSISTTSTAAVPDGQWVWVLATADFTAQTITIYADGVEVGSAEMLAFEATTPDTTSDLAVIGADDTFAASDFFPGSIDEVRGAGHAVDAAWVEAQYLSMTDALLSYE